MNRSCVQLNDLPDELLIFIFKHMNNVEVLYSLFNVNERLDSIVQDSIFTNYLSFLEWSLKRYLNIFSPDIIFHRFCLQILPAIHEKIQWLCVESSTMKQILCATDYPNLYGLGLFNLERETIENLFTDVNLSSRLFQNQISKLLITIDIKQNVNRYSTMKYIMDHIFRVFKKLTHLIFFESSYQSMIGLSFQYPSINFFSETLLVLNTKVATFDICLYFLDGRFNQLHTLIVESKCIYSTGKIENQRDIPTMKRFSLSCYRRINCYEKLILPCLYRMSNLETLNLSLSIVVEEIFFDGHHVKNKIVNHIPRLNRLTFDIRSIVQINTWRFFPSKVDIKNAFNTIERKFKDIPNTFEDFQYTQVICYFDHFLHQEECQCHAYTYPSQMSFYQYISNQFPGGYYPYVRVVSLYDEYPFEHQFFLQLVQSFPFIQKLILFNDRPQQQHKQYSNKSISDSCHLSIVEYCHLIELDIERAYDDYIEQFLCHTKTSFRQNIRLRVNSHGLFRVTKHFTRQDTRMNCAKVDTLLPWEEWRFSKSFQEYFPSIKEEKDYICSDFR